MANGFHVNHALSLVCLPTGELVVAATLFPSGETPSVVVRSLRDGKWHEEAPVREDGETSREDAGADRPQLVVDGLGRPVLAFRDGDEVVVFRREGGTWRQFTPLQEVLRTIRAGGLLNPLWGARLGFEDYRLAIDDNNQPVIAYSSLSSREFGILEWRAAAEPCASPGLSGRKASSGSASTFRPSGSASSASSDRESATTRIVDIYDARR